MRSTQRRIGNFDSLSAQDLRLLGQALLWVVSVRIGLWMLPYRVLRRWVPETVPAGLSRAIDPSTRRDRGRQVARWVTAGASYVPHASCLTQALSGQALLCHEGVSTTLRIGVARDQASRAFRAHAWLECEHEVILGGDLMVDFTAFESLPPAR